MFDVVAGIGAGASILGGLFGSDRQNQQAIQQYIQSNHQSAINNGREIARAAQATANQYRKNSQIREAAYTFGLEATKANRVSMTARQNDMSNVFFNMRASAITSAIHRNVNGGTSESIRMAQLLNLSKENTKLQTQFDHDQKNIRRQVENAMKQQSSDVFIGNYEMGAPKPILTSGLEAGLGSLGTGLSTYAGIHSGLTS